MIEDIGGIVFKERGAIYKYFVNKEILEFKLKKLQLLKTNSFVDL